MKVNSPRCLITILTLVLMLWTVPSAHQGPPPLSEVLLKLGPPAEVGSVRELIARHDLAVLKRIPRIDVWVVTRPQTPATELTHRLAQEEGVLWAEPNGRIYATGAITPNDTYYLPIQWNLRRIRLPEAWAITTGSEAPIAVLDTGIDLDHVDLAAKIWMNEAEIPGNGLDDDANGYVDDVHGWNFVAGTALLAAEPHGTHVAGIAAAHTDNGIGIAGVSWQSTVMPLQVMQNRTGEFADLAEGIIYAADNGARVLNLSLGGDLNGQNPPQTVEEAIAYARGRGCLLVVSSGSTDGAVLYPASSPETLAVAATTTTDAVWSDSNRGPEVDVSAPGAGIYSLSTDDRYTTMTGTSQAAPHVSGLAALIWSRQPILTADQVAHIITDTAQDVNAAGWDEWTGWGRIDALNAIQATPIYAVFLPLVQR